MQKWLLFGLVMMLMTGGVIVAQSESATIGYTHVAADGNHVATGTGTFPNVNAVDVPLDGQPAWVVGVPDDEGSTIWAVVLDDGRTQAFAVDASGEVQSIAVTPSQFLPGMPPILQVVDGAAALLWDEAGSPFTHPAVLPDGSTAAITEDGDVILRGVDGTTTRFAANALPDARLLVDEGGNIRFLVGPSEAYGHGVLGDALEATAIGAIDWVDGEAQFSTITLPLADGQVIEGIMPLWAGMNGDDVRDVIVTVSDASQGAVLWMIDGVTGDIATSSAIGQGYRWRHQIAVAPFGPGGEVELVSVLTPHLGGVVQFHRLIDGQLERVAEQRGYTSHVIGTRNLDLAAAADFDGDGQVELLLPDQRREELGAVQRTASGAIVDWKLPLDGVMVTNIGVVSQPDGTMAAAVGREDGVLRLFLPQ